MIKRPHSYASRLQKYSQRAVVGIGLAGVAAVAYIIWTTPEGYTGEIAPPASICIDDSSPWGYPAMTPYSELFEDGKVYGKDGEEIIADGRPDIGSVPDAGGIDLGHIPGGSAPAIQGDPSVSPAPYNNRRYFNGQPGTFGGGGGGIPFAGNGGSCAHVVDESKSWHLIVIGLFAFAVWRWVGRG